MTKDPHVRELQPRWLRRDSEPVCFSTGGFFAILAIILPIVFLTGSHRNGFIITVTALLEASWLVLSSAYLRSGFFKRTATKLSS